MGGVDCGFLDYSATYSIYLTVPESYALAGQNIFLAFVCSQTFLSAPVACLKAFLVFPLVELSVNAQYIVQDGQYVNTAELDLTNHNGTVAPPMWM